jgi:glycosyltransferase involved in cell wall biosynthesis
MVKGDRRYIIISPVRDEEAFLPRSIEAICSQTLTPVEYILVDDGSTDATARIIKDAASRHPWIRYVGRSNRGDRRVGPGVIEAFYDGYRTIESREYEFVCKMDGDLTIGPRYFEALLTRFGQDRRLGSASGKLYLDLGDGRLVEERIADESVLGGMLCYRRECFERIGGFVPEVMWDGIAFHRCRMEGWRTRSFPDSELRILDHRIMGSSQGSIFRGRLRWGWGQYFMGTHPLYILAIGAYRAAERPFVIGGALIVLGYLKGWITASKRYDFPGFRRSLHAWQLERLKLGKRLETLS